MCGFSLAMSVANPTYPAAVFQCRSCAPSSYQCDPAMVCDGAKSSMTEWMTVEALAQAMGLLDLAPPRETPRHDSIRQGKCLPRENLEMSFRSPA